MGAWFDDRTIVGKTLAEAYRRGQEDARHEDGHGGYTGTIAEKHDVVEIALPKRMTAKRFVALVVEGMDNLHAYDDAERKEITKFWEKRVPAAARPSVLRAAKLAEDKWGAAVAVELHGAAWTEAKKWHRVEKQRGVRAWRVFGLASC